VAVAGSGVSARGATHDGVRGAGGGAARAPLFRDRSADRLCFGSSG
jgi:hypothetical protein